MDRFDLSNRLLHTRFPCTTVAVGLSLVFHGQGLMYARTHSLLLTHSQGRPSNTRRRRKKILARVSICIAGVEKARELRGSLVQDEEEKKSGSDPTRREKRQASRALSACLKDSIKHHILNYYATCVQKYSTPSCKRPLARGKKGTIHLFLQQSSYRYHFYNSSQSLLHTNTARLCPGSSAGHTTDTHT